MTMHGNAAATPLSASDPMATTAVQAHAEHEATAFGLAAPGWVALSMIVVIAILIWKKVPAMITRALDAKIGLVRQQLGEANALRAEAEAMWSELEKKAAQAHKDAEAIIAHAQAEASHILVQARADADTLIERRGRMAEDKIAAAERSAIAEVRARAAAAAAGAAAAILAKRHDAKADAPLIDRTIASLN